MLKALADYKIMLRNKKLKKMSMIEDIISIGDDNSVRNWPNIEPELQIRKENSNVNGSDLGKLNSNQ